MKNNTNRFWEENCTAFRHYGEVVGNTDSDGGRTSFEAAFDKTKTAPT